MSQVSIAMQEMIERAGPPAVARAIEALLQESRVLRELRSAGLGIVVLGDHSAVVAETVSSPGRSWPTFNACIRSDRWWSNEGADELRIATRLAAELRMKWDRWISEGADTGG
jgi:hypothetical protein